MSLATVATPSVGDDLDELRSIGEALRAVVGRLDAASVPVGWALPMYETLDQVVRMGDAGKTLLAPRVAESGAHRQRGLHKPADLLAAVSGGTLGAARDELATGAALGHLSATREALVSGRLSAAQARIIADAASKHPTAETSLIATAAKANLQELREAALRAKRTADPDPEATEARIHANRRLTRHTDAEGAVHLRGCGTPADASVVLSEVDAITDATFRTRDRSDGSATDNQAARMWDALVQMARNSKAWRLGHPAEGSDPSGGGSRRHRRRQPAPEHLALLRIDLAALRRGHLEGEELCEIAGVGPISLRRARELLGDAALKVILTDGVDVLNVTTLRREPRQAVKYAMLWTSPGCVAQGCSRTRIEYDHRTGVEYTTTHHTRFTELDGLCGFHHRLHTFERWALVAGRPGAKRPMVPPTDMLHPLHPDNPDRVIARLERAFGPVVQEPPEDGPSERTHPPP